MEKYKRYREQRSGSDNPLIDHGSALDNYILARKRNRLIIDERNYNNVIEAAGRSIAAAIDQELEKIMPG